MFTRDYGTGDVEAASRDHRDRQLLTNQKNDESTEKLLRAQRTAQNSEQIGREILGALEEDRVVLERAKSKVAGVNEGVTTANKVLWGISTRVVTNKIILIFIILLLLASIGVIVYLKWGRNISFS
jgi:phage shock protein PspC (stress-responsive transcriptional regulator)